jgi:hypothetical protein
MAQALATLVALSRLHLRVLALLIPDQVLRVSSVAVGLGVCLERAQ